MNKYKKSTVQLTPLLDLLFVMVFVSLIQSQSASIQEQVESQKTANSKEEIEEKTVEKPAPKPEKKPVRISVQAIFHFYKTAESPNIPEGKFAMEGTFNRETGALKLGGVNWIKRPPNYDMIPLSGKIDTQRKTFQGRIEFHGCKKFTLRKTSKLDSSEVFGSWEGSYTCGQGETGLTLTLHK